MDWWRPRTIVWGHLLDNRLGFYQLCSAFRFARGCELCCPVSSVRCIHLFSSQEQYSTSGSVEDANLHHVWCRALPFFYRTLLEARLRHIVSQKHNSATQMEEASHTSCPCRMSLSLMAWLRALHNWLAHFSSGPRHPLAPPPPPFCLYATLSLSWGIHPVKLFNGTCCMRISGSSGTTSPSTTGPKATW